MSTITLPIFGPGLEAFQRDPLSLVARCNGYYECPRDASGNRTGPLVGYAGEYQGPTGPLQYVGDTYVNFAEVEKHAMPLDFVAKGLYRLLLKTLPNLSIDTVFCGAPEGGKALAVSIAQLASAQYIYPERKVTALKTETSREQSELVFERHGPEWQQKVWIVEDICHNFSTTDKLIALIEQSSAEVQGIICFLNRSMTVDDQYRTSSDRILPVISLVRKPIPEYEQDDPEVANDVATGNVVLKPKNEWRQLKDVMRRAA